MKLAALVLAVCGTSFAATPLTDIDGKTHDDLDASSNRANVLYFVTNDCPISNQYAPEINRICDQYEAKDVACYLVYIDPTISTDDIRQHLSDYSHSRPAIHDTEHKLVRRIAASVTPEVALTDPEGNVLYQGRINNFYAALGKPRRMVTQHDLRDAIDSTLAGDTIETAKTQALGCFIPDLAIYKATQKHDHHHK